MRSWIKPSQRATRLPIRVPEMIRMLIDDIGAAPLKRLRHRFKTLSLEDEKKTELNR